MTISGGRRTCSWESELGSGDTQNKSRSAAEFRRDTILSKTLKTISKLDVIRFVFRKVPIHSRVKPAYHFIPNERLKVRAKFRVCDWYVTMRSPSKNCLSQPSSCHLPKGNSEVYYALACILWDKYKQNFEKIAWVRPVMDNFRVCSFSMAKASVWNPMISCATGSKKPTNYHTRVNIFIQTCPQMT